MNFYSYDLLFDKFLSFINAIEDGENKEDREDHEDIEDREDRSKIVTDIINSINIDSGNIIPRESSNAKSHVAPSKGSKGSKGIKVVEPAKLCVCILKTGQNKGNECGKKVSAKSNSGLYCAIHLKHEDTDMHQAISQMSIADNSEVPQYKFSLDRITGRYVFGKTGLVLKSKDEKIIIGKQVDGKIIPLSKDDIALCKRHKFKHVAEDVIEDE